MAKFTVRGDKEINRNFRRTVSALNSAFMSSMMKGAFDPMKDQTKENARTLRNFPGKHSSFFPQPTGAPPGGHLDQGVAVAKFKSRGPLVQEYWLGFNKRARKIAHLVEYGTAPHYQPNFKGGFHHPGAAAQPFFRPAFESTKNEVVAEVSKRTWARIAGSLVGAKR